MTSILASLATLKPPTNELKDERFECSRNLWGIRSGDQVEVYVT